MEKLGRRLNQQKIIVDAAARDESAPVQGNDLARGKAEWVLIFIGKSTEWYLCCK